MSPSALRVTAKPAEFCGLWLGAMEASAWVPWVTLRVWPFGLAHAGKPVPMAAITPVERAASMALECLSTAVRFQASAAE